MFSIFEYVVLFFPKHSNFKVFLVKFTKKSCKSAKTFEDCVVLGMMKKEDSRGLKTLQREELCSQDPGQLT